MTLRFATSVRVYDFGQRAGPMYAGHGRFSHVFAHGRLVGGFPSEGDQHALSVAGKGFVSEARLDRARVGHSKL